jgi:hypothetical protein
LPQYCRNIASSVPPIYAVRHPKSSTESPERKEARINDAGFFCMLMFGILAFLHGYAFGVGGKLDL